MALLKHRGITRASYDALIAPDPNTEYTVLETDGTFTRYIGSKAIKDKTAARLDNDGNIDLGGKALLNYRKSENEDPVSKEIFDIKTEPHLIFASAIEEIQFDELGEIHLHELDYSILRNGTKKFIMIIFRTDEGMLYSNTVKFSILDDYGILQIIYDTQAGYDTYRAIKCNVYDNSMEIYCNASITDGFYPPYLLFLEIWAL